MYAATGRVRPFILTAIFTGLRASELRGLRWADVDFEARALHVRQRADRFNSIGPPKSEAGERTVPLPPLVVNVLREWKLACPKRDTGRKDEQGRAIDELVSPKEKHEVGINAGIAITVPFHKVLEIFAQDKVCEAGIAGFEELKRDHSALLDLAISSETIKTGQEEIASRYLAMSAASSVANFTPSKPMPPEQPGPKKTRR